jgi:hypothetical protein
MLTCISLRRCRSECRWGQLNVDEFMFKRTHADNPWCRQQEDTVFLSERKIS